MEHQIKSTRNYNMFKKHPLNRKISDSHVEILMESIEADNQLDINPVIVDSSGHLISGQHRLAAARRLGVPIYYIEKDVKNDYILFANQCQRKTTAADAIEYYITTKDDAGYKLLKKCYDESTMPYGAISSMIGMYISNVGDIINGKFKVYDPIEEAEEKWKKYRELKHFLDSMPFEYKTSYKSTHFCQALRKIMDNDDIPWAHFMIKVRNNWSMLDCGMPTATKWHEQMLRIYNKHKQYKIVKD